MEIIYTINKNLGGIRSFLHNAEFSSYYSGVLEDFKGHFPGINTLNVDLQEKFEAIADFSPRKTGKLVGRDQYDIVITFSTYPDGKRGVRYPNANNVFSTIKYSMQDEVKHFRTIYDTKNPILHTRLKQLGIDMSSNLNTVANELHGYLGSSGYKLDLNKRIWSLSEEDIYQLGRVIIVSDTDGKVFSHADIIRQMSEKLEIVG
jgi:hypothetical protein